MATASTTNYATGGKAKADPPCLAEALRLLAQGYWPVPITPPDSGRPSAGKAPIGKAWGVNRPTEAGLRATWAKTPGASVGLKLGPEGGLIDVEVDDPTVGADALNDLLGGECVESLGWESAVPNRYSQKPRSFNAKAPGWNRGLTRRSQFVTSSSGQTRERRSHTPVSVFPSGPKHVTSLYDACPRGKSIAVRARLKIGGAA